MYAEPTSRHGTLKDSLIDPEAIPFSPRDFFTALVSLYTKTCCIGILFLVLSDHTELIRTMLTQTLTIANL